VTPESSQQGQQRNRQPQQQQQQSIQKYTNRGGRHVRNQRQFGTSVGVSLESGMTDELQECMAAFSNPKSAKKGSGSADDRLSDISSDSSDDEELLSFNIFGKK